MKKQAKKNHELFMRNGLDGMDARGEDATSSNVYGEQGLPGSPGRNGSPGANGKAGELGSVINISKHE